MRRFLSLYLVITTQVRTYTCLRCCVLAWARLLRHDLLKKQQDDLGQSILGFTEAILSLPLPRGTPPWSRHCRAIVFPHVRHSFSRQRAQAAPKMSRATLRTLRYLCADGGIELA
jgi:hypothetical protein